MARIKKSENLELNPVLQTGNPSHAVPLCNINAKREYNSMDEVFEGMKITEYCAIPGLKNADWAISVKGNGMYPKYLNGDILICRVWTEEFIIWGKPYVVFTKTGILVRKLKQSSDEGCITAESYSEDYPPFDIPKNEIIGLAIVVAAVKYE